MPSQQEQPAQQQPPAQPPPRSSPATLVLGGAAACVALITAATAPFLAPGLLRSFGVPFNPTESLKLRAMLRHLPQPRRRLIGRGRPPAALVDLGSVRTARRLPPHPTCTPRPSLWLRRANREAAGQGDGRIVVAAARQGYHALGYEFNPWLVLWSRASAFANGVSPPLLPAPACAAFAALRRRLNPGPDRPRPEPTGGTARFVCGNMWGAPLGEAEVVVLYGVDELMADFRQSKSSAACANADVTCRDRLTYD